MSTAMATLGPAAQMVKVARPKRRGTLTIPAHCHPLVQFLFAELNRQMVTMSDLSERVGCDYHTVSSWRYCQNPRLELLVAAMNALGFDLLPVPRGRDQ